MSGTSGRGGTTTAEEGEEEVGVVVVAGAVGGGGGRRGEGEVDDGGEVRVARVGAERRRLALGGLLRRGERIESVVVAL